jgi:hypothetical protein
VSGSRRREEGTVHGLVLVSIFFASLALFFVGIGVLLWGTSKLKHSEVAKAEIELRERQLHYERTQAKDGGEKGALAPKMKERS